MGPTSRKQPLTLSQLLIQKLVLHSEPASTGEGTKGPQTKIESASPQSLATPARTRKLVRPPFLHPQKLEHTTYVLWLSETKKKRVIVAKSLSAVSQLAKGQRSSVFQFSRNREQVRNETTLGETIDCWLFRELQQQ